MTSVTPYAVGGVDWLLPCITEKIDDCTFATYCETHHESDANSHFCIVKKSELPGSCDRVLTSAKCIFCCRFCTFVRSFVHPGTV